MLQRKKAGDVKITNSSNILNAKRLHIAFFGVLILTLDLALTECKHFNKEIVFYS